jgi:hypothetical protein
VRRHSLHLVGNGTARFLLDTSFFVQSLASAVVDGRHQPIVGCRGPVGGLPGGREVGLLESVVGGGIASPCGPLVATASKRSSIGSRHGLVAVPRFSYPDSLALVSDSFDSRLQFINTMSLDFKLILDEFNRQFSVDKAENGMC